MTSVERHSGTPTGMGWVVGGGYRGATVELDALVQEAGEMLAESYGMDVVIRFNSNRNSGSAWLKTDNPDGVWLNAEIGIGGFLVTQEGNDRARDRYGLLPKHDPGVYITAHIGKRALVTPGLANESGYYHGTKESLTNALYFVRKHGSLDFMVKP